MIYVIGWLICSAIGWCWAMGMLRYGYTYEWLHLKPDMGRDWTFGAIFILGGPIGLFGFAICAIFSPSCRHFALTPYPREPK